MFDIGQYSGYFAVVALRNIPDTWVPINLKGYLQVRIEDSPSPWLPKAALIWTLEYNVTTPAQFSRPAQATCVLAGFAALTLSYIRQNRNSAVKEAAKRIVISASNGFNCERHVIVLQGMCSTAMLTLRDSEFL